MLQIEKAITYCENFLSKHEANLLYNHLITHKELTQMMEIKTLAGDRFTLNTGKLMFLDKDLKEANKFPESIWGKTKIWSDEMFDIKSKIETFTNEAFATCVCIYYPNGNSGVDYHSDKIAYGDTNLIPSISLGEERKFCLKNNLTQEETCLTLNHGSLLLMKEKCQENFQHSLPINSIYKNPRINLTFRKYGFKI